MTNLVSFEKEFSDLTKRRGFLPSLIDKDISDSWKRCISNGLDPLKNPKRTILTSKELDELKEKNEYIRRLVNPELELLYSQIAGTNFMVAYSDSTGSVMDTIYDKTCLKTDVGKIVIPGSIWREEVGGTNGLGQVVSLNKDSIVSGKEHFFESHGKLSCFASPILNHEGKAIGILDASTDVHSREQHTLALVKLATKSIETKLFLNRFKDELILSFHPRQEYLSTNSVGLLAINGDGFIVGSNSNARIMLHGLLTIKNEKFNNIFITSFSSIANEVLQNKITKISDHLGSSVFIIKSQNFKKRISKETKIKNYSCNNCKGSKFKEDRCILIKSTFLETGNISAVSRRLGVSRTTIYKHLK